MIMVQLQRHTPATSTRYIGLDELIRNRFREYQEVNKCIPLVNRVRNINPFQIGGYDAILHPDKDAIVGKVLNIGDTHLIVGIDDEYRNLANNIANYEALFQCIVQPVGCNRYIVLMVGQIMIKRR